MDTGLIGYWMEGGGGDTVQVPVAHYTTLPPPTPDWNLRIKTEPVTDASAPSMTGSVADIQIIFNNSAKSPLVPQFLNNLLNLSSVTKLVLFIKVCVYLNFIYVFFT